MHDKLQEKSLHVNEADGRELWSNAQGLSINGVKHCDQLTRAATLMEYTHAKQPIAREHRLFYVRPTSLLKRIDKTKSDNLQVWMIVVGE